MFMKNQIKSPRILYVNLLFLICISLISSCKQEGTPNYTSVYATSEDSKHDQEASSDSIIAQISEKYNFRNDSCAFTLAEDSKIRVVCYGEGADYIINPSLIEPYDNDGIEVYFDMKNEKFAYFNVNGDDHQYRILWNLLTISGQNTNTEGLVIKESDPSAANYIIEMKFPWKSLGYFTPRVNSNFGFDVAVLDNDGATREAMVAWYSNSYWSWNNTSYYGTVVLGNSNTKTDAKNAIAVKANISPVIDGHIDELWKNIPFYKFKNVITGKLDSEDDLSGYFKSCWDEENFYLLVNVEDNVKSIASVPFDYGWIEDTQGNVVWKMEMSKTKHSGGGVKNRYIDTLINLDKGQYYLRYQTDESNCPDNWDVEPSGNDFYGIKLLHQ
jgi:hypothetical protein